MTWAPKIQLAMGFNLIPVDNRSFRKPRPSKNAERTEAVLKMAITFVSLVERHFPLLLKWLETPHVKAWWDQDIQWTYELIQEKYAASSSSKHCFIICFDKVPIGYIQYYSIHDFSEEPDCETASPRQACAGLDWHIGDPDYIGKGIGPKALVLFLKEDVYTDFDTLFVDPDTANRAAIRAYEKAGFRKIKTVNNGKVTWMLKERV
jgi:aminoglycoside 6'-N-acetyltransferase